MTAIVLTEKEGMRLHVLFNDLMIFLSLRRERIVTIRVALSDTTVFPVDEQFRLLIFCNAHCNINCFGLCRSVCGSFGVPFAFDLPPAVRVWRYMLILPHMFLLGLSVVNIGTAIKTAVGAVSSL